MNNLMSPEPSVKEKILPIQRIFPCREILITFFLIAKLIYIPLSFSLIMQSYSDFHRLS